MPHKTEVRSLSHATSDQLFDNELRRLLTAQKLPPLYNKGYMAIFPSSFHREGYLLVLSLSSLLSDHLSQPYPYFSPDLHRLRGYGPRPTKEEEEKQENEAKGKLQEDDRLYLSSISELVSR